MASTGSPGHGPPQVPADLSFDLLRVGQAEEFDVLIDETMVRGFATLTGDRNPLHTSPEYARGTVYGQPIAHGMLLASFFSTIVGMLLPGRRALYLSQSLKFAEPVHWGERVKVRGEVVRLSPDSRILELKTTVTRPSGVVAVAGEAKVMLLDDAPLPPTEPAETALDFTDKVVMITGASRGIGAATALTFASLGAHVAVNYKSNREAADRVVSRANELRGRAIAVGTDVARADQVREAVDRVQQEFGPINILIHGATGPLSPKPFMQLAPEEVRENIDIAVMGAVHCIQAVLPGMIEAGDGRIITVHSSGTLGRPEVANAAYVAAKHALEGLSKSLAVEFGPKGIRVNLVAPGFVDTDLVRQLPTRARDVYAHQTPLRRVASPQDIAKAIVYLASDLGEYLSGVTLPVCGGHYMG